MTKFRDLNKGDIFRYKGRIYQKMDNKTRGVSVNARGVHVNWHCYFQDHYEVNKISNFNDIIDESMKEGAFYR